MAPAPMSGVVTFQVWAFVVHIVLGAPPREAQTGERPGQDACRPRVPRGRGEHLPMGCIVPVEAVSSQREWAGTASSPPPLPSGAAFAVLALVSAIAAAAAIGTNPNTKAR